VLNDEFIEDAIAKLELWITVLDLLAKRKLKKLWRTRSVRHSFLSFLVLLVTLCEA